MTDQYNERLQRTMLGHGLLVILVSMFAGYMLMFGLTGGLEVWPGTIISIPVYGTTEGWVRAHTGGVTNGLLVLAVAFALPKLNLQGFREKLVAWGFIYVAWSFTVFYWLGNAAPNRALTYGDNPMGESTLIGILGFLPGLPSVIIVVVVLIICAHAAFAGRSDNSGD